MPNNTDVGYRNNIAVSFNFNNHGRVGGVENAAVNFFDALLNHSNTYPTLYYNNLRNLPSPQFGLGFRRKHKSFSKNRFIADFIFRNFTPKRIDIAVFPNYFLPPTLLKSKYETWVIIHDLQFFHFPSYFSKIKKLWLNIALFYATQRADKILCISKQTKNELLEHFNVKGKVCVLPNRIKWEEEPNLASRQHFALTCSHFYPHKNLEILVYVAYALNQKGKPCPIYIIGSPETNHAYFKKIELLAEQYGVSDLFHFEGFVERERLIKLYKSAKVFLFPSKYEGFGMPPVEALGYGCPAVCSDIPILREVTVGEAIYLESDNPLSWVDTIESIIDFDSSLKQETCNKIRDKYSIDQYLKYLDSIIDL